MLKELLFFGLPCFQVTFGKITLTGNKNWCLCLAILLDKSVMAGKQSLANRHSAVLLVTMPEVLNLSLLRAAVCHQVPSRFFSSHSATAG